MTALVTGRRFYTLAEVAEHNAPQDCWVSILGEVFDITELVKGPAAAPLLAAAGTDISHWFDAKTGDVKLFVDPVTNLQSVYCPQGKFIHVAPTEPRSDWNCGFDLPWWKNADEYRIGRLTSSTCLIRIMNMLTESEDFLEVPKEESIAEIRDRYMDINSHAASYNWKALKSNPGSDQITLEEVNMNLTLEENGIGNGLMSDEMGLSTAYSPVLCLYWCDDLTTA
ncbi:hypothetical protein ABBQ32_013145 [Trebouxia sp. C0010 RCD-2024]